MKKRGFCFLVSNESRDYFLLLGIIYYLERFENFEISFEFIWDAYKIKKTKPSLVILPNERGNDLYYEVAQYCKENNILVISNDSEGNFNTQINYDFWGYNLQKDIVCPFIFTWNSRVKEFLIKKYKIEEKRLKLAGAPGFDKYKYLPKIEKNTILKKYNKQNFTKIVGYAGWAFGKLQNSELSDIISNLGREKKEGVKWLTEQRDLVEDCLKTVVEQYPDILFILKKHPRENFESDYKDSRNEMNQLRHYPNVLYLKDEEDIQNLIQISDLWMAFESTSIMEAWLMNIPTLMINPDRHFTRVDLYKGSAFVKNPKEILNVFQDFFTHNDKSFCCKNEELAERASIIQNSIGFDDGFNHLRFVKPLIPFIKETKSPVKIRTNQRFLRFYFLLHIGKHFYSKKLFERLPKLKKTIWIFENYKLQKVNRDKKIHFQNLNEFYSTSILLNGISIQDFIKKLE
jgi:surface carbohydrate biosynthesis protein